MLTNLRTLKFDRRASLCLAFFTLVVLMIGKLSILVVSNFVSDILILSDAAIAGSTAVIALVMMVDFVLRRREVYWIDAIFAPTVLAITTFFQATCAIVILSTFIYYYELVFAAILGFLTLVPTLINHVYALKSVK